MNNQTVKYTPMFVRKTDSQNDTYYEINYRFQKGTDGKITGTHFATNGTLVDVKSVVKLYSADTSNRISWRTTKGAT